MGFSSSFLLSLALVAVFGATFCSAIMPGRDSVLKRKGPSFDDNNMSRWIPPRVLDLQNAMSKRFGLLEILDLTTAFQIIAKFHTNPDVEPGKILEHAIAKDGKTAYIKTEVKDKNTGNTFVDELNALKKNGEWVDASLNVEDLKEFTRLSANKMKDSSGHIGKMLSEVQIENLKPASEVPAPYAHALLEIPAPKNVKPLRPSHENCKFYLEIFRTGKWKVEASLGLSSKFRSQVSAVNQYCACSTTLDQWQANIVRGYLQAAYKKAIRENPNKVFTTADIEKVHIDAYRKASCECGPAPSWAWQGVTSVPFATWTPEDQFIPTCKLIDLTIRVAGSCRGCKLAVGLSALKIEKKICAPCSNF